ncbi:MAG: LytR family transcriptional regulator [Ruminococcaceae bacterium]|nr:LytR family transcriptional regulator [Oscillospiraceae bacterium]
MKKIIALILVLAFTFSMVGCGKISNLGSDGADTNADGSEKALKSKTMFNFLVMGHDRQASLTDVVMLVSYDTDLGKMTVMQLPRDTYIEIEDYSYCKLNGLYNHCVSEAKKEGSENASLDGCVKAADYLSDVLGVPIHYSAVMDLDGFGAIVDAVGGVEIYVPYTMEYEDEAQNLYINLQKGYNTLDGNEAEQFVRFRSGLVNADLGRADAQKMFMTAFIEAVKENIGIKNVGDIATAIINNVDTDLHVREIVKFGTAFLDIELSDITMMTAPGEVASSYYVLNKECLKDVLNESFNIYVEELTDEEVDKNVLLCDEDSSAIKAVYEKPADELSFEKHNAQDVSDEDIYVPLK